MSKSNRQDLLTVAEVADWLRTSPTALYSQRYRGEAPGSLAVRVGARLLWKRRVLDEWLDSQLDSPGLR